MIKTSIFISNKLGLHARASAKLTKLAGSFACEVFMTRSARRVNAKSIMGVMMLAAGLAAKSKSKPKALMSKLPWTPSECSSTINLAKASERDWLSSS